MDWSGRLSTVAALAATIVFGAAAQTQATVPPHNVGWLYTTTHSGAVFFDADFAGHPSEEKVTVCDNKSDGRGIRASVGGLDPHDHFPISWAIVDPSNDGHCVSFHCNCYADGYAVEVDVMEDWGDETDHLATGKGVA
jgi:hypothetical protein